MLMCDDHTCRMEGICTIFIKIFDGMVRELKDVRYVSQLKKNLISFRALEAQALKELLEVAFSKYSKARWLF